MFLWFVIASWVISYLIFPYLISLLIEAGCTRENFRGKLVPVGSGILFLVTTLIIIGLTPLISQLKTIYLGPMILPLLALILGVGFLGLLDDLLGDRSVRGFVGHFRRLREGNVTTGVLKALGSGALSLFIAWPFSAGWFWLISNSLIIALSVNLFNLLDLRPGRALKVFLVASFTLFVFGGQSWLGLFIGPAWLLLRADLEERTMLGDVGSNVLGAVVGFAFMVTLGELPKIISLAFLIFIQLFAEKYSISEFIAQRPILRRLDQLGRKH